MNDADFEKFFRDLKKKVRRGGIFAKHFLEIRYQLTLCLENSLVWLALPLFEPFNYIVIFCRFLSGNRFKFRVYIIISCITDW